MRLDDLRRVALARLLAHRDDVLAHEVRERAGGVGDCEVAERRHALEAPEVVDHVAVLRDLDRVGALAQGSQRVADGGSEWSLATRERSSAAPPRSRGAPACGRRRSSRRAPGRPRRARAPPRGARRGCRPGGPTAGSPARGRGATGRAPRRPAPRRPGGPRAGSPPPCGRRSGRRCAGPPPRRGARGRGLRPSGAACAGPRAPRRRPAPARRRAPRGWPPARRCAPTPDRRIRSSEVHCSFGRGHATARP